MTLLLIWLSILLIGFDLRIKPRLCWEPLTSVTSKLGVKSSFWAEVWWYIFRKTAEAMGVFCISVHRSIVLTCDMPEFFSKVKADFWWERLRLCPVKFMRLALGECCQLCGNARLSFLCLVSEAHKVCVDLEACHSHAYFRKQQTAQAANLSWQKKPGC